MRTVIPTRIFTIVAAGLACIAGVFILALFPVRGGSSVWSGYRVLAVPYAWQEKDVVARLDGFGVKKLVTESNSRIVSLDPQTPILPFLDGANARSARWFSDGDGRTRFMFLEDTSFLDTRVEKAFRGESFDWYLEKSGGFSLLPVLCAAFFLAACAVVGKNRGYIAACGIPFVLLAASSNRIPGLIASVLAIFAVTALASILFRGALLMKGAQLRHACARQPILFAIIAVPAIPAMLGGMHQFSLFASATVISVSAAILYAAGMESLRAALDKKRLHPAFRPVAMTSPTPRVTGGYRPYAILAGAAVLAVLVGIFPVIAGRDRYMTDSPGQELSLPVPTRYTARGGFDAEAYRGFESQKTDGGLPDLADFIAIRWNIRIYPWKKILTPFVEPEPGQNFDRIRYAADETGKITETSEILATFNTEFIRETLSSDITPLERMLVRQGRFVSAEFKRLRQ